MGESPLKQGEITTAHRVCRHDLLSQSAPSPYTQPPTERTYTYRHTSYCVLSSQSIFLGDRGRGVMSETPKRQWRDPLSLKIKK